MEQQTAGPSLELVIVVMVVVVVALPQKHTRSGLHGRGIRQDASVSDHRHSKIRTLSQASCRTG